MSNVSVRFKNTGVVNVGPNVAVISSTGSHINIAPQQTVDLNVSSSGANGNVLTQIVTANTSNGVNVVVNVHNLNSTLSIYCAATNGESNITIGPTATRTRNVSTAVHQIVGLI